jgi:hypothetical protein
MSQQGQPQQTGLTFSPPWKCIHSSCVIASVCFALVAAAAPTAPAVALGHVIIAFSAHVPSCGWRRWINAPHSAKVYLQLQLLAVSPAHPLSLRFLFVDCCSVLGAVYACPIRSTIRRTIPCTYDLHTKGLGLQLFFGYQLQLHANTHHEKLVENVIARHLFKEIVHRIIRRFVRIIARVDGPIVRGRGGYGGGWG